MILLNPWRGSEPLLGLRGWRINQVHLPQPLRQDCLAVAETSRTSSSAVGGDVGGEAPPTVNLGGARMKHAMS